VGAVAAGGGSVCLSGITGGLAGLGRALVDEPAAGMSLGQFVLVSMSWPEACQIAWDWSQQLRWPCRAKLETGVTEELVRDSLLLLWLERD